MIKVIGFLEQEISYKATYNQSARVFNIESEIMNDKCKPCEESTGNMVFLVEDLIGEIESIYPIETEFCNIHNFEEVETICGVLRVMIDYEEKNTEIVIDGSNAMLIFDANRKAEKRYISGKCSFYVADSEVVAIACEDVEIR